MSLNECLYHYHTQVGGQYFGSHEEVDDGVLFITHRGIPMVLRVYVDVTLMREYTRYLRVSTNVELERTYELRIRGEGMMSKGLGVIRNLRSSQNDFGQPELLRKRNIEASDDAFTKLVLQDLDFRNQLEQCKRMKVTVLPSSKDGATHLATAAQRVDELTWTQEVAPFTEGAMLQPEQKDGVVKYLNEMLDLCYYACRAVQAYRMPEK